MAELKVLSIAILGGRGRGVCSQPFIYKPLNIQQHLHNFLISRAVIFCYSYLGPVEDKFDWSKYHDNDNNTLFNVGFMLSLIS